MNHQVLFKPVCILLLSNLFFFFSHAQPSQTYNLFHAGTLDKSGNIWWGMSERGVYRYNAASGTFANFTKVDGLCDNSVNCIYEDRAGVIWFGTAYGVCTCDPARDENFFTTFKTKENFLQYNVSCILEDRSGNFWFGTMGYGVCKYDPRAKAFTNYTKKNGLTSNAIQIIFEDNKGILWFGTRGGGVCRYDPSTVSNNPSVRLQTGPVSVSHVNEKIFSGFSLEECGNNQIMGIIQDNEGNLWIADLYGGVCRYNPASGSFTHFSEENGFCNDTITCLYRDKSGNLWFGHDRGKTGLRGGICRYDFNTGTFTQLSTKDGLPNPDVWGFVEDNAGNIWIGTRGGLCKYDKQSGVFTDVTGRIDE